MKITRSQLKQIIKEELTAQEEQMAGGISSMAQEIYEPEEYASINFEAIIKGAIKDLGLEELNEISRDPQIASIQQEITHGLRRIPPDYQQPLYELIMVIGKNKEMLEELELFRKKIEEKG